MDEFPYSSFFSNQTLLPLFSLNLERFVRKSLFLFENSFRDRFLRSVLLKMSNLAWFSRLTAMVTRVTDTFTRLTAYLSRLTRLFTRRWPKTTFYLYKFRRWMSFLIPHFSQTKLYYLFLA